MSMNQKYEKLKIPLEELFQLAQPDLDTVKMIAWIAS